MAHSLTEDIRRGRRAIVLARERGLNTAEWEERLAELEQRQLLAWAAELSEQQTVLSTPVCFVEAPLVTVTTSRVSEYAARYLRTLSLARSSQAVGTPGRFTNEWWERCTSEALGALAALKAALDQAQAANAGERE